MTDKPAQQSLEGLRLVTKEDLKEAVREVLQEEGILDPTQSRTVWSDYFPGPASFSSITAT